MNLIATLTIATLTSILYFTIFWSLSIKFKKTWLADLAWATGFFVVYLVTYLINKSGDFKENLILLMLFFGALRAGTFIVLKHLNVEDSKHHHLVQKWGSKWAKKSYVNIFVFQALLLVAINCAPIIASLNIKNSQITFLDYLIVAIWILGFLIESISDLQLYKFKSNPLREERIFKKGLWAYTRHPNYLGKSIMWFAIFLIVLPLSYGYLGLISLILIFVINIVSIRKIEYRLRGNPEYQEYIKTTHILLPYIKKPSI